MAKKIELQWYGVEDEIGIRLPHNDRRVRFITSYHKDYDDNPIDGLYYNGEFYDSVGDKIFYVSAWAYLDGGDINNNMTIEEALNFDW